MKTILLVMLLLFSTPVLSQAVEQTMMGNTGRALFRVANNTPFFINCFYRDDANYFTFSLAPHTYSMWYPIFGRYQWRCQ